VEASEPVKQQSKGRTKEQK